MEQTRSMHNNFITVHAIELSHIYQNQTRVTQYDVYLISGNFMLWIPSGMRLLYWPHSGLLFQEMPGLNLCQWLPIMECCMVFLSLSRWMLS